jgi:hypothetical protein
LDGPVMRSRIELWYEEGVGLWEPAPELCTGRQDPQKGNPMILSLAVGLNEILEQGPEFLRLRPEYCPNCRGNRLRSHGFVQVFFDGCPDQVRLRRYRCPECRCIIRLRPAGYFKRFQASIHTIRSSIASLFCTGRRPVHLSRSRQDYWLRNLSRRICARFGLAWLDRLLEGFDSLIGAPDPPVSRLK